MLSKKFIADLRMLLSNGPDALMSEIRFKKGPKKVMDKTQNNILKIAKNAENYGGYFGSKKASQASLGGLKNTKETELQIYLQHFGVNCGAGNWKQLRSEPIRRGYSHYVKGLFRLLNAPHTELSPVDIHSLKVAFCKKVLDTAVADRVLGTAMGAGGSAPATASAPGLLDEMREAQRAREAKKAKAEAASKAAIKGRRIKF